MFEDKFPFIIFLAICHIITLLVFFIFILLLVYLLVRKKNTNRIEKIGAIAITSIIFNKTLDQAILTPIQVLVVNLQKLFYLVYVYTNLDNGISLEEQTKILEANPLNEQVISIQEILYNFPLSKLLIAISIAILTIFLFLMLRKILLAVKSRKPKLLSIRVSSFITLLS